MVRRILLRIGDYVFVTRPLILIPVWSFYILGASAGGGRGVGLGADLVCLTAVMVTAYLVNQVFDQESDRRNDKGHYLTRGLFSVRAVVLMALVAFAVASFMFQRAALPQRLPLALALVLSLAYSLPPIRLCARPFLDLAVNAVGYGGIAYLVGYLSRGGSQATGWVHAAPYILLVGATFLHTTILDATGDRDSGKRTSAVVLGVRASARLGAVLASLGLLWAAGLAVAEGVFLPLGILAAGTAVFVVAYARTGGRGVSSNAIQLATALVTVPAAVIEPGYAVLVVVLVVVARMYHRARFGIGYPGPVGPGDPDAASDPLARASTPPPR